MPRFHVFAIGVAAALLASRCSREAPKPGGEAGTAQAAVAPATPTATVEVTKSPSGSLRRGPACDLISRAEMSELIA